MLAWFTGLVLTITGSHPDVFELGGDMAEALLVGRLLALSLAVKGSLNTTETAGFLRT